MRMLTRRTARSVAMASVLTLLLVACGGDDAEEPAEEAPAEEEPAEEEPAEEEPAEEEPAEEEPAGDAPAADEGGFYEGATIRYIVPTAPGGGAAAIAEFMRPYWQEYLPGQPTIEIDYQEGAGGTLGANEFALRAETDGNTVMQGTLSSATAYLLGEEQVQYDYSVWDPVIAFATSGVIHARTDTGIESVQDVLDHDGELFIGGRTPTASDIMHVTAMEVLGLNDKVSHIWGYEGTGEQLLAIEQDETQLDGTTDNAFLENGVRLVEEGITTPILSYGIPDGEGGFAPHPQIDAPTVDAAYEEIHGEAPSGEAWDAFRTVMDLMSVATVVVLPEGAPPEAREAWAAGVDRMVAESDFVEEFTATLNPTEPVTSNEDLAAAKEALAIDPEIQTWIRDFLQDRYPDQLG